MKPFHSIILAFSIILGVKGDLPVHCLASDVAGKWTFYLNSQVSEREQACGHMKPDKNTDHIDEKEFSSSDDLLLDFRLSLPNIVEDERGDSVGNWTMVYDEGFYVEAMGYSFFAFSKYTASEKINAKDTDDEQTVGYFSECSKTFKGWYTSEGKFGCFFGKKTVSTVKDVPHNNAAIFHGKKGKKVVQREYSQLNPEDKQISQLYQIPKEKKSIFSDSPEGPPLFSHSPVYQTPPLNSNGPIDPSPGISLFDKFQKNLPIYEVPHNSYMSDDASENDNQPFSPDYSFIELVNSKKSKLPWRAKAYESFSNKTHGQMKKLIGMSRYKQMKFKFSESLMNNQSLNPNKFSFLQIHSRSNFKLRVKGKLKKGVDAVFENCEGSLDNGLPRCFDWRNVDRKNYDTPIKSQGDCGSCYAEAFLSALESRIRIKTKLKHKPFLSTSNAISCSRSNQGCNGGYPWLVAKYGKDIGFVDTSCSPSIESDNMCDDSCLMKSRVWKVKNFGYVGNDYYGSTNEEAMLKEIYKNGPITIAFNAAPDLYYYSSGVFITNPKEAFIEGDNRGDLKPWQFTNHAVVCVGWGETNHEGNLLKYWIFKNSWGEEWGEGGYFRILRGVNLGAVENQAVYADPEI